MKPSILVQSLSAASLWSNPSTHRSTCSLSSSYGLNTTTKLASGIPDQNPFSVLSSDAKAAGDLTGSNPTGHFTNQKASFNPDISIKTQHRPSDSTPLSSSEQCPTPPVLSCSAQAADTSACCVQKPGGALVHVQFWDENEGQQTSWGIHGLWPDMCDGSYDDSKSGDGRAYSASEIADLLPENLKSEMEKIWVSNDDSPPEFWEHEWKTHGVRVSTLEPSCFENYKKGQEVPLFFGTVVALFNKFEVYTILASAGITPSNSQTYTLAAMQNAVETATGFTPDFLCDKGSTVSSVQFYLNAQGPVQNGELVQATATRQKSCPASGIKYPVKDLTQNQGRDETRARMRREHSEWHTRYAHEHEHEHHHHHHEHHHHGH